MQEMEMSRLLTKGRISRINVPQDRDYSYTTLFNKNAEIDGVFLKNYDTETKCVSIRADHSENPEFWMEINLDLMKLQKWLKFYRISMELKEEDDEDKWI